MIWIDLTDLQQWSGHMTGIPRLVYNISSRFARDEEEIGFFAYDSNQGVFYVVEMDFETWFEQRKTTSSEPTGRGRLLRIREKIPAKVLHRIPDTTKHKLKHVAHRGVHNVRRLKSKMQSVRVKTLNTNAVFNDTDTVIVLGNAWNNEYTLRDLGALKQDRGFTLAVVIYDLIPSLQPQFFGNLLVRQYTEYMFEAAANADLLLPISESTDRDIAVFCEEVGLPVPATEVIRLGDELSVEEQDEGTEPTWYTGQNFMLCVSTLEVRKNHTLFYYMYKKLLEDLPEEQVPELVLVGSRGWYTNDTIMLLENDPAVSKKVRILSGVPDDELNWMYQNTLLTLWPSLYEGWGLPVAESLAYGKVALSSNSSSMPEIGGELVEYFSPYDPVACAELVQKYLDAQTRTLQEERITKEYKVTTWEDCYQQVAARIAKK